MKHVNATVRKDSSGNWGVSYSLDGYEGMECSDIANVMSQLGEVTEMKSTDDAYAREIPLPVPNQQRS